MSKNSFASPVTGGYGLRRATGSNVSLQQQQNLLCQQVLGSLDSVLSETRQGRWDALVKPSTWEPFVPGVVGSLILVEKWVLDLEEKDPEQQHHTLEEEDEEGSPDEKVEKEEEDESQSLKVVSLFSKGRVRDTTDVPASVCRTVSTMIRCCTPDSPWIVPSANGDESIRSLFDVLADTVDCILIPFQANAESDILGGILLISQAIRGIPFGLSNSVLFLRTVMKGIVCTTTRGGRALIQTDSVSAFSLSASSASKSARLLKRATSESAIKRSVPLPFDGRKAAIVTVNTDGRIVDWDPTAQSLFGWEALEVVGRAIAEVLYPEPYNEIECWLNGNGSLADDNNFSVSASRSVAVKNKEGKLMQTRVSFADLPEKDGVRRVAIFEIDGDISMQSLGLPYKAPPSILHSGVALILTTSAGIICFANLAAERMFSVIPTDLVGSPISSLISGTASTAFRQLFQDDSSAALSPVKRSTFVSATINQREVIPAIRRKNEKFPVHVSFGEVRSWDRTMILFCFHDLTREVDKLKLELENKNLRHEIARLQRGPFGAPIDATLNHDIQTPLDQVIEKLRVVSRSIFLDGEECSLLWGAISSLSQGGAKLLQPVMQEPARSADLDLTTRLWLVREMGLSISCSTKEESGVGEAATTPRASVVSVETYQNADDPTATPLVLEKMRKADMCLDCFELESATGHQALYVVVVFALESLGLLSEMGLNSFERMDKLRKFLTTISGKYNPDIPYHNATHAADVVYSCFCLLTKSAASRFLSPMEKFSLIFACAIHDVDHRGTNNNFQVNAGEELALIYNDRSVMENHHVSCAFKILNRPECKFTSHFSPADFRKFRSLVIDLVLITDMTQHFTFLSNIKGVLVSQSEEQMSSSHTPQKDCLFLPEHSALILQAFVKLSDLGHTIKPLDLHKKWSCLIQEEFFRQGDQEKRVQLPPSPFMDREKDDPIRSQVGFFEFVVVPFAVYLSDALGLPSWVRENAETNSSYWAQQLQTQMSSPPSAKR